jgi:hypothetical protein
MDTRRISASWLSDDMAHALAAMCPPMQTADVLRAADKLTEHAGSREVLVVDGLFQPDVDRVNLRNVIKSLRALHDRVFRPGPD